MSKAQNSDQNLSLDDVIFPNWHMFVYLAVVNFLVAFMAHELIFTEELYRAIYADQMELARIDKFVDIVHRFSFWSMLALPLVMLIKFTVITFLLQIPLLLKFIEVGFKYLFRWVMLASLSLTAGQVLQFLIIYFLPIDQLTPLVFKIKTLSVGSMINPAGLPDYSIFLFNQLNVFEIIWTIIIYTGLVKSNKIAKSDAVLLTVFCWVVMLLLQWLFIYFLTNLQ